MLERQQTLRNTIAWSYDLLEPGTQAVFRAIWVFVGGCSLEGAEAVAGRQSPGLVLDELARSWTRA
jgi:predicted ATPase